MSLITVSLFIIESLEDWDSIIHVNDGLDTTNSALYFTHLKSETVKAFRIKDLGPVTSFIGFQFKKDRVTHKLWIHQENYIDNFTFLMNTLSIIATASPLLLI